MFLRRRHNDNTYYYIMTFFGSVFVNKYTFRYYIVPLGYFNHFYIFLNIFLNYNYYYCIQYAMSVMNTDLSNPIQKYFFFFYNFNHSVDIDVQFIMMMMIMMENIIKVLDFVVEKIEKIIDTTYYILHFSFIRA